MKQCPYCKAELYGASISIDNRHYLCYNCKDLTIVYDIYNKDSMCLISMRDLDDKHFIILNIVCKDKIFYFDYPSDHYYIANHLMNIIPNNYKEIYLSVKKLLVFQ